MTTDGKRQLNWCSRCHHAIVSDGSGWGHFSDDDWAPGMTRGGHSECVCVGALVQCRPERPKPSVSLWGPAGSTVTAFRVSGSVTGRLQLSADS